MSKIDDARNGVDGLDDLNSPVEDFLGVYVKIIDAGKTITENDRQDLNEIVKDFRGKMRDGISFQKLRDSARKFQEDLTATIIGTGMANIAARNQELLAMLAPFGEHIAAANEDANRLQKITENINKATEAVKTVKTLVSELNNDDADTRAKVQAVITALEKLNEIF